VPAAPAFAGGGLFVEITLVDAPVGAAAVSTTLWDFEGNEVSTVTGNGNNVILFFPDVPAGEYWVSAQAIGVGGVVYAREFLGGVYWADESLAVEIFDGAAFPTPEPIVLEKAGAITGDVTVSIADSDAATLEAYRWDGGDYRFLTSTPTNGDDEFALDDLPAGDYLVRTVPANPDIQAEWWQDALYKADADVLTVAQSSTQSIQPVLDGNRGFGIDRLAGADRFETSVLISQELFPIADGPHEIPVLYIANGLNYPDALSAGPAASHLGGGLLLVTPATIPDVVLDEIERLNPQKIVIAGGTPSVSAAVATELAEFAEVERFAGDDRYETSRMIVEDAFGCSGANCQETVFIATGTNFPDALAAGPAAAVHDAPVLLVYGAAGGIDLPTGVVLDGLDPRRAVILGSTASVSAGIQSALENEIADVERFSGANRYDTAALLNAATFGPPTERAYVATGAGFADALAGGPLAAAFGAPMVLTPPNCGTNANYDLLVDLYVIDIVYLGGLSSVGDVVLGTDCGF
jgi:hypothetical protein